MKKYVVALSSVVMLMVFFSSKGVEEVDQPTALMEKVYLGDLKSIEALLKDKPSRDWASVKIPTVLWVEYRDFIQTPLNGRTSMSARKIWQLMMTQPHIVKLYDNKERFKNDEYRNWLKVGLRLNSTKPLSEKDYNNEKLLQEFDKKEVQNEIRREILPTLPSLGKDAWKASKLLDALFGAKETDTTLSSLVRAIGQGDITTLEKLDPMDIKKRLFENIPLPEKLRREYPFLDLFAGVSEESGIVQPTKGQSAGLSPFSFCLLMDALASSTDDQSKLKKIVGVGNLLTGEREFEFDYHDKEGGVKTLLMEAFQGLMTKTLTSDSRYFYALMLPLLTPKEEQLRLLKKAMQTNEFGSAVLNRLVEEAKKIESKK